MCLTQEIIRYSTICLVFVHIRFSFRFGGCFADCSFFHFLIFPLCVCFFYLISYALRNQFSATSDNHFAFIEGHITGSAICIRHYHKNSVHTHPFAYSSPSNTRTHTHAHRTQSNQLKIQHTHIIKNERHNNRTEFYFLVGNLCRMFCRKWVSL